MSPLYLRNVTILLVVGLQDVTIASRTCNSWIPGKVDIAGHVKPSEVKVGIGDVLTGDPNVTLGVRMSSLDSVRIVGR
jgi:hypothetical protein